MTLPTAKEIKYDRQLRLWSANGQEALEKSRLCLINATATGTEILKNLVLPGFPPLSPYSGANERDWRVYYLG